MSTDTARVHSSDSPPLPWHRDPVIRLLVAGGLLNSVAFFATLPFLTIYLSDISALSPASIGAVVGAVALVAAFGGLLGGLLTDRWGAVTLVRAGLAVDVLVYGGLMLARSVIAVVGLVLLLGVGRLLVEPSMKKLLSLAAGSTGSTVFRLRYITICVGAMVGPLIGAALYTGSPVSLFAVPTVVFALYLVLVVRAAPRLRAVDAAGTTAGLPPGWRSALADRTLLLVVAGGTVVFFVFSQFESILPLFIKQERGADAVAWFSTMLAANALVGILLQFPAARLARHLSQGAIAAIGTGAFAVSLPLFALLEQSPVFLYVGVLTWTVGEALMIPLPDMLIHDHTPPQSSGTAFGLAELRYAGFFLGPLVGGALLPLGVWPYAGSIAVAALCCWPLLALAARRVRSNVAPTS